MMTGLALVLVAAANAKTSECADVWDRFRESEKSYLEAPGPDRASDLAARVSDISKAGCRRSPVSKASTKKRPFATTSELAAALERRLHDGDATAAAVAMDLLTLSDGESSEWLAEILAKSLDADPRPFLRAFANRSSRADELLRIAQVTDSAYVDDFPAQQQELKDREAKFRGLDAKEFPGAPRCAEAIRQERERRGRSRSNPD